LTPRERQSLVGEVQRLRHTGAREIYLSILKEEQALTDEEIAAEEIQQEIAEYVEQRTTIGQPVDVPEIPPADEASISRGKTLFQGQGCNKCHGDDGSGDATMKMLDDEGFPTTARDFTKGIFKGGDDVASLYRRIIYGMPGTPMPSSQITPAQAMDLAHFIRSLSDDKVRQGVVQRRQKLRAQRVTSLPQDRSQEAWSSFAVTTIRLVPLWWRNDPHPELQVQAVHDTEKIMLRLVWKDPTFDRNADRAAAFKDAVAVELYRGKTEPFVGMGARGAPVDVWFWDADRQSPTDVEVTYPRVVVDMYPFSETQVATAEYQRTGTEREQQPAVSLPAVASGNQITPRQGTGGSGLTAGGPGTMTFRIPKNQLVDAEGQWADGQWSVMMQRPLAMTSSEQGISLDSQASASIAFAVWNGALKDRDGQKLVSIWHDLELE
jgi:mono/diheme cytochrome c family protein